MQQEDEAISMARVKEEFAEDFSYERLYENHHEDLGLRSGVVGNLPQLNSCSRSVVINPMDKVVKSMANNKISEEEFVNLEQAGSLASSLVSRQKYMSMYGRKQGKCDYLPNMNRNFTSSDK